MKNEALVVGMEAYNKYMNGESSNESRMLYSDYLDYWMKEYFEVNYIKITDKRIFKKLSKG